MPILAAALLACTVTDGDTIRCGVERIRLIGIDAPELPGHCSHNRHCARGDAQASKAALQRLVDGRALRIERMGQDRYGRTLAFVWSGHIELACAQLRARQAIYRSDWDVNGRTGRCRR